MASSPDELNKSLLKLLECPVCFKTCSPPIRMCVRSHIVCSECAKNLTDCATCRQPMATERSWFSEEMYSKLKFPCKHVTNGCEETFDLSELKAHLPDCDYKNYDCLIGGYFDNGVWKNVCEWKGPGFDLLRHAKETHVSLDDFNFNYTELRMSINIIPVFNGDMKPGIRLMSAHDNLFWKITCFWPPSEEIEFIVLFVGSKDMSNKFQYRFDLGGGNGGKLSFHSHTVPCSLDERVGKTLKICRDMRSFLNDPDGSLSYKLTILENK